MKTTYFKILIIISVIFYSNKTISQIEKGNWLIGGTITTNSYLENNPFLTISPSAGYFITDKIVVGSNINLLFGNSPFFDISVNAYSRLYFKKEDQENSFFTSINLSMGLLFDKSYQKSGLAGIGGGYVWFITKNIGLEAEAKAFIDIDANIIPALNIGFQIYLDGKK